MIARDEKIGEKTGEKMALMKINVVPEECRGKRAVEQLLSRGNFQVVGERYSIVFRNNEINSLNSL